MVKLIIGKTFLIYPIRNKGLSPPLVNICLLLMVIVIGYLITSPIIALVDLLSLAPAAQYLKPLPLILRLPALHLLDSQLTPPLLHPLQEALDVLRVGLGPTEVHRFKLRPVLEARGDGGGSHDWERC